MKAKSILHWFNPLVWLAFIFAGKDMEMTVMRPLSRKWVPIFCRIIRLLFCIMQPENTL